MKFTNIKILKSTFGLKKASIDYHNNLDGLNYKVECEDIIHPDLHEAKIALESDLANACHAIGEDQDYFSVTGFVYDEKDGIITVEIKGQLTNPFGYITKVSSGKIPQDETQEKLKEKLETLRKELFAYFFESKTAQGNLDGFPTNAEQEQEMGDEDPQTEAIPEEKQIENFESDDPPIREPQDEEGLFDEEPAADIKGEG